MNDDALPAPSTAAPPLLKFLKAGVDIFSGKTDGDFDWGKAASQSREHLSDAINAKNVAFLLGAGCSSTIVGGDEKGISTMGPLAAEFTKFSADEPKELPSAAERKMMTDIFGINISSAEYAKNLERLMEVLHSLRFVLARSSRANVIEELKAVDSIIGKAQRFLWNKCTKGKFSGSDDTVLRNYQSFYRKLVLRDRSLPRPWVFTTNYDLFNETAMDRLGLPFANGFSGIVERRFNPATFRYALAEQLDLTSRKWTAVDGFVYLCKLHGSISWTEDDHGLYPIREVAPTGDAPGKVMIYPTPAKHNASLGSPYSDLFREFQSRVVREQSVLFTIGYAFGDQHINNIIYQALTIPTFRLVIFADPDSPGELAKLTKLDDPRIWIIGGPGENADAKAHYFETVVDRFFPQRPSERIEEAVQKMVESLSPKKGVAE